MTKPKVRVIFHTDAICVPGSLNGVVELDIKELTLVKKVELVLTGRISKGPNPRYTVPYKDNNGMPYKIEVNTTHERQVTKFWTSTVEIGKEDQCYGNGVQNEYMPGIHYIHFSIPLEDFPVSFNDPSHTHSLYYSCSAFLHTITPKDIIESPPKIYTIIFNNKPKVQLGTQKKATLPPNPNLIVEMIVQNTTLKIGDKFTVQTIATNKSHYPLNMSLALCMTIDNLPPITIHSLLITAINGVGTISKLLHKEKQQSRVDNFEFEIPPGLFPTCQDPNLQVNYAMSLMCNLNGVFTQLCVPLHIVSLPPPQPIFSEHIKRLPIQHFDRQFDFNTPFRNIFMINNQPRKPFMDNIEQVMVKDQMTQEYYVDHFNKTTLITPDDTSGQPPFPYPHWRNVILPTGFITYYFENKWCYINLYDNTISYQDPRPVHERIPFYTQSQDHIEFYIRINAVRDIPIMEQKAPSLTFVVAEYDNSQTGKKLYGIKAQELSLEPDIPQRPIVLKNVKNRMNVVVKVFQKNTFSDTVYGYIDIDFYRIPMGVEITDWLPIITRDKEAFGMGEVNVSFGVRTNQKELYPIMCNCLSKLTKLYYPNTKHLQTSTKHEDKYGKKMRKEKKYLECLHYEVYTPVALPEKLPYLRMFQGNKE